jgi:hypothetical protein
MGLCHRYFSGRQLATCLKQADGARPLWEGQAHRKPPIVIHTPSPAGQPGMRSSPAAAKLLTSPMGPLLPWPCAHMARPYIARQAHPALLPQQPRGRSPPGRGRRAGRQRPASRLTAPGAGPAAGPLWPGFQSPPPAASPAPPPPWLQAISAESIGWAVALRCVNCRVSEGACVKLRRDRKVAAQVAGQLQRSTPNYTAGRLKQPLPPGS